MSKYKKVWLDKDDDVWTEPAQSDWGKSCGPFTKGKIVPRDAIVIEVGDLPEVGGQSGAIGVRDLDPVWREILEAVAIYRELKRRQKKGKKK